MVINSNNPIASKILQKSELEQKESIQYCIDLALLEKQQLKGEALERFILKAKQLL